MTSDDDDITVEEVRRKDCQHQEPASEQQSEENKPEGLAIATFVQQQQQLGEQANIQSSSRGSTPGGLQAPLVPPSLEPGERVASMTGSVYNVPPDHSHYTRGREVGLLMEVPGVRRMEDRGEERRRREERGEDRRVRRMEDRGEERRRREERGED